MPVRGAIGVYKGYRCLRGWFRLLLGFCRLLGQRLMIVGFGGLGVWVGLGFEFRITQN